MRFAVALTGNAHDAAGVTTQIYRMDGPNGTQAGLQANFDSLKAQGYTAQDFTPERSAALVRLAAGVPDLAVNVLGIAPWVASAHVAEQYRHGRIFLAGNHTSWVILLTDLNSRIPVTIEPEHSPALLAGDNQKAPMLETLAQGAKVKPGDQVVSSGDGGILPPGIPIGTVIADGAGYRVALLSDPATSQEVAVVDFKNPVEAPPVPTARDLPVTAAGLPPAAPPPAVTTTPPPPAPAAVVPKSVAPAPKKDIAPKPAATAKPAAAPDATSPPGDDPVEDQ